MVEILKLGRMYESPIWTIIFGTTGKTYNIHESVLKESPVLAAMCKDGFAEAKMARIDLPEDEAADFHHVIGYLYRGDLDLEGSMREPKDILRERADELARVAIYSLINICFTGSRREMLLNARRMIGVKIGVLFS